MCLAYRCFGQSNSKNISALLGDIIRLVIPIELRFQLVEDPDRSISPLEVRFHKLYAHKKPILSRQH